MIVLILLLVMGTFYFYQHKKLMTNEINILRSTIEKLESKLADELSLKASNVTKEQIIQRLKEAKASKK
jgi:hypothetical protein